LEARQWECLNAPKATDSANRLSAAASLNKVSVLQMRRLQFENALSTLQKSVSLSPGIEAIGLAGECFMGIAGRQFQSLNRPSVLSIDWDTPEHEQAFMLLRQKLKNVGYTKPGLHWSYPNRLPVVIKFAGKTEMSEGPLADAFKLFMMHEVIPLGSMVELIGHKASRLLLGIGAVTCFNVTTMKNVPPTDAPGIVHKKPETPLCVFSNMMLWPLQEDLLVAFDFEQLTSDRQSFDPVVCLAQDSRILMLSAPRAKASKVLDVDCGSGAQGLIALQTFAETAVFLDSNSRALNFARFSVYLNGFGKRAKFVAGSLDNGVPQALEGEAFDAILMCPPCFPVPSGVACYGGSALTKGGADGQKALASLVKTSDGLLSPGGRLVTTAMLKNPDSFAERLKGWLQNTNLQVVVLQGEHITAAKYESMASAGSSIPSALAFSRGLAKEGIRSMAQGILMLWKPLDTTVPFAIDVRSQHLGLWSDDIYAASELEGALSQFQLLQNPSQQLYSIDWDDADNDDEPLLSSPMLDSNGKGDQLKSCWSALRKPRTVHNGRLPSLHEPQLTREPEFSVVDGATWQDLPFVNMFGYYLPCLMDQLWRKVDIPLGINFPPNSNAPEGETRIPRSNFGMALVEFEDCGPVPEVARDALHSLDCYDQLSFEVTDGQEARTLQKKHFGGWRKKLKEGEAAPNMLERYDTFIIPISEQAGKEVTTVPKLMREFLDYLSAWVEKKNVACRVVVMTCGATGPTFPDGLPEEMLHRAAPLRGLLRCARVETPELPILSIDTDEMGVRGDAEALADQLSRELEAYTPASGLENASPEEFSEAVYRGHREVSWRKGERFFPGLNPAARNPVNANINLDHLKLPAEGVALITGGSGGLGVVTAGALVECGVRCIVLASRSGKLAKDQGLEERVAKMEKIGAKIVLMGGCDTAKEELVVDMLNRTRQFGDLKYVFHAAGIFDFDVEKVFGPKVSSAWWLHKYTLQDNLDAFVCFASMTECIGTAGMSSYAQANTYMEELCRYRHALVVCGTAVQFPEVMGVGMASSHEADSASISNDDISQIMKVITAGTEPIGPVISIMTFGFMMPRPPISYIYHEPLLRRVNTKLWTRLTAMEAKIGGKRMKKLREAKSGQMTRLNAVVDGRADEGQE
jgi:tRNA1(Val) A37 N6-methylase TrmN6